ncbi:hypothetical protein [Nesterenkonia flava]|uniref:Uncharacterized protein n=1 Tax=Nesterenkonia flava TaxID=469799 RepID=A0ABU1FQ86_9MICC|nr:hypothetical protein [Nesterenkonia flava]MDR5710817.1 hypothetical protein [Nesterenkonia flava]
MLNSPSDVFFLLYMAGTFALIVAAIGGVIFLLRRAGERRRRRALEAAGHQVPPHPKAQRRSPSARSQKGSSSVDGYL